jgi:hypothetical protein
MDEIEELFAQTPVHSKVAEGQSPGPLGTAR